MYTSKELDAERIDLVKQIIKSFEDKGIPPNVASELTSEHPYRENEEMGRILEGLKWSELPASVIESPYPAFSVVCDEILSYYLPAWMIYAIEVDSSEFRDICSRLLPRDRKEVPNPRRIQQVFCLYGNKLTTFVEFLEWGLRTLAPDYDISLKKLERLEKFRDLMRDLAQCSKDQSRGGKSC